MTALYFLGAIGGLICAIMVLIQLGKAKGALHVILGILCGFYPFIWGWMNAKALNLSKIMIAWTICIVLTIVSGGAATASMTQQIMEQQKQMQAK